ncbi:hypothetical protein NY551_18225 [Curtobacterium flaccumfaciens pv. oortii]|uniref:hypothetical protein n=1 Tax=Curtobacterium flaccumfaciens TaxID=2035 RepID=UPI002658C6BA|nr:hypothetical protein [Curtobacterium flaccumfaciens]MCS5524674.1 hypothetical protein [Curtobacterium flaccumfaciens pv. oortii]
MQLRSNQRRRLSWWRTPGIARLRNSISAFVAVGVALVGIATVALGAGQFTVSAVALLIAIPLLIAVILLIVIGLCSDRDWSNES